MPIAPSFPSYARIRKSEKALSLSKSAWCEDRLWSRSRDVCKEAHLNEAPPGSVAHFLKRSVTERIIAVVRSINGYEICGPCSLNHKTSIFHVTFGCYSRDFYGEAGVQSPLLDHTVLDNSNVFH